MQDKQPVSLVMQAGAVTCAPGDTAERAALLLARCNVGMLPVSDGKRILGVVSLGDVARRARLLPEAAAAVADVSSNRHRL
ncbi:MAG: CBS domain-containing protein [Oscillospiraceae bacterium]|nr:CBS domain-containing protein [Oscillospiraceae bacterium]